MGLINEMGILRRKIDKGPRQSGCSKQLVLVSVTMALLLSLCLNVSSASADGIWISKEDILLLPMSGSAWKALKDQADRSAGTPNLSDQE